MGNTMKMEISEHNIKAGDVVLISLPSVMPFKTVVVGWDTEDSDELELAVVLPDEFYSAITALEEDESNSEAVCSCVILEVTSMRSLRREKRFSEKVGTPKDFDSEHYVFVNKQYATMDPIQMVESQILQEIFKNV